MELSPGQRMAAFTLVVIALAGLGIYLFVPSASGVRHSGGPAPGSSPSSPGPGQPSGTGATGTGATGTGATGTGATGTGAASVPPSSVAGSTSTSAGGAPDIYQWLPFTQSELAAAAGVAKAFCDDYGTFSYSQTPAGYVAAMRNLVTPGLSDVLARAFAAPGVASLRDSQKQVSTATASISSLRAFGSSSLTFVVSVDQAIADTQGRSSTTVQYAVTVGNAGGGWQASDIELASAGNP